MLHNLRRSVLILGALVLGLASCASPTLPTPELGSVKNLVATPSGKSVTLTWNAVANAKSYTVWYTVDGTDPTTTSTHTEVSGTTLVQTGLDETLTYKYAVQPTAKGYDSVLSSSVMVQPLNVMTFSIGQAGANQSVVIQPYYAAGTATSADWDAGNYQTGTPVYGKSDASGNLTLVLPINRVNQWGWTVALDNDSSHTINTGDTVWGSNGAGLVWFLYYTAPVTVSVSRTYNPWADRTGSGTNGTTHFY